MILNSLISFLGIKKLPPSAQGLVQKFFLLASLQSSFFMVSGTFYVLFVIDQVGFEVLGFLLAVSYIVQALFDYPSGVMGDWIGQKWILATSFITYGLSYGLLVLATSVVDLLFVYLLAAFARSQESGAMQSWFDNNYKFAADVADPKREIYQIFQGKMQLFLGILWGITFIVGGLIATILYRETVFAIQSVGMFILAGLCLVYVNNFSGLPKPEKSFKNYKTIMREGLSFAFFTKYMLFYVISECIAVSAWVVWGNMILFPMYYGYTGSDIGAAVFRLVVWISASSTAAHAGKWGKKFPAHKWLPRTEFFIMVGYFGIFAILIWFFPLEDNFNLFAVILITVIFFFLDAGVNLSNILRQRLLLDIVPDKIRNSVYSLLPTLTLIISSPVVLIAGSIIEILGLPMTLIILTIFGIFSSFFLYVGMQFLPQEILSQVES